MTEPADSADNSIEDMEELRRASDLRSLEDSLTKVMAKQRAQALIRGDDLSKVVVEILRRVPRDDFQQQLTAAAMLGRLAAVARGREQLVYAAAETLFTQTPPALDTLEDGNAKTYAAQVLRHVQADWVLDYCLGQSIEIDAADIARKELLSESLKRCASLEVWFRAIAAHSQRASDAANNDAALRRYRRIVESMVAVATDWQGDVGAAPGAALAECAARLLGGRPQQPDVGVLAAVVDHILDLVHRVIQLRFSHALQAEIYEPVERCRDVLGIGLWAQFLTVSRAIERMRTSLLESAVVLARQNRTDKRLVHVLSLVYPTKASAIAGVRLHFTSASDVAPEVRRWWESLGTAAVGQEEREHKVGNTEDEQIGTLLLEAEGARESMDKIGRAVVPFLDISDGVLAATVRRAVAGYYGMAQTANRLARIRRLTRTTLKGERIEFNPLEHHLLGERSAGVRWVRVVRDGVQKDFGGRPKTLIKPWVEPEE